MPLGHTAFTEWFVSAVLQELVTEQGLAIFQKETITTEVEVCLALEGEKIKCGRISKYAGSQGLL